MANLSDFSKNEQSLIAAEAAGIIVGRIMKLLIIVLALFGLFTIAAIGMAKSAQSGKKPDLKVDIKPQSAIYTIPINERV